MMLHGSNPTAGLERLIEILGMRYEYDVQGRIVATCTDGLLPRFILVRGAEGCAWRFRAGLPETVVVGVAKLAGREPGLRQGSAGVASPPERLAMIERLLAAASVEEDDEGTTRFEEIECGGVSQGEIWTLY